MATAFMPMPPAGSYMNQAPYYPPQQNYYPQQQQNYYPQQQPQTYSPPPYPQQPQYQQQYPQQWQGPPQLTQQVQYPPQQYQGRATPPGGWPRHAGEYMGPGVKYNNYRDEDTPDYNNPPEPQFGIPESQRGEKGSHSRSRGNSGSNGSDPRFVFPDNTGLNRGQPGEGEVGPNGERGLGATVLGGGAGAFLGHKLGHGAMGTIGGLAIGAIAANAFEHHEKKKKEERRESRAFDDGYRDGEERRGSRSRGLDDGDDRYYEDERYDDRYESRGYEDERDYYEPRHHHHHRDYDDQDDYYYQQDDYREDDYYRRDNY